jgi:hypothetical protein
MIASAESRQHHQIDRTDGDDPGENKDRGMTVGDSAAEKVADAQGGQNRRDQRGPGEDAAAEKRTEVA